MFVCLTSLDTLSDCVYVYVCCCARVCFDGAGASKLFMGIVKPSVELNESRAHWPLLRGAARFMRLSRCTFPLVAVAFVLIDGLLLLVCPGWCPSFSALRARELTVLQHHQSQQVAVPCLCLKHIVSVLSQCMLSYLGFWRCPRRFGGCCCCADMSLTKRHRCRARADFRPFFHHHLKT